MQENSIGRFIKTVREERNISQRKVCQGLCSTQTLSNIEVGERVPDVFLFENLTQRLGISPDDFETVLFDDEYNEIALRDRIESYIEKNQWTEAKALLELHYSNTDKDSIRQQYYWQIQAILLGAKKQHEEAIVCIEKAIGSIHDSFSIERMEEELFGTRELELLCMLADEYRNVGEYKKAHSIINALLNYMQMNSIQPMELVKTYPKAVYLYAVLVADSKERVDSICHCEKAFNLMVECDSAVCLPEIMEILMAYYDEMGLENRRVHLEKQLDSLKALYEEFGGCIYATRSNLVWFKESYRKEYLLCKEMIRGERNARGMTAEELSEGIYENPETVVRIENGHQNPSKKSYEAIMRKLGLPTMKYNSPRISEGEEIYKIKERIVRCFSQLDFESAKLEMAKLELLVDKEDAINCQYLARQNAYIEFKFNKISAQEFCERTVKALQETYAGDVEQLQRIPTLEERYILNNLAISYWEMGETEKGIGLFRRLLKCYETSKVSENYHFRAIVMLLRNYLMMLEESGMLKEALEIIEKEVKLEAQAFRVGGLDVVSAEKMCIYEQMDLDSETKKKAIAKYLQYAFYVSDLFMRKRDNAKYDKYYRTNIDSDIEWYI